MPCPSRVLPLGYLPPTWAHPSAIPAALPWPLRESSPGESETEGRGPCPHYMPGRWENQAQSLSSIQAASPSPGLSLQGSFQTQLRLHFLTSMPSTPTPDRVNPEPFARRMCLKLFMEPGHQYTVLCPRYKPPAGRCTPYQRSILYFWGASPRSCDPGHSPELAPNPATCSHLQDVRNPERDPFFSVTLLHLPPRDVL